MVGERMAEVGAAEKRRREALAKGEIDVRVKRTGMFQHAIFKVVRKDTPLGKVPYLKLDKFLDLSELMRVSEEYQLPIEAPSGKIFPRGKRETDFLGL